MLFKVSIICNVSQLYTCSDIPVQFPRRRATHCVPVPRQVRAGYLAAKRFSREQVASVLSRDPFWLMFSTARIDRRLGLFSGLFGLSACELRQLAARCPGLITSNVQHVKVPAPTDLIHRVARMVGAFRGGCADGLFADHFSVMSLKFCV